MAETPYSGVSEVSPQVQTPDDYQHIQTNPNQFGAQLGQGLDELGAGMYKASLFYGQAAADNAANNYQTTVNNLLHGDPNKMITGPDGQQVPDTGYMGLKGRAALDARPGVAKALEDARKSTLATLQTPEQRLQFDNYSRRYSTMAMGQMGEHSDQQANVWYGQVNKDSAELALGHIATNFDNPALVASGTHDLRDAYAKNAQLEGAQPGDSVFNAALARADRDGLIAQVNAMGVKDPAGALALLDKNRDKAGVLYDNAANSLRARADQQNGQAAGAAAIKASTESAAPAVVHNQVTQTLGGIEQHYNLPSGYLAKTMQIESGGRNLGPNQAGATGYFQFIPSTAAHMHVNPNDFSSSADGAARLAVENAQHLRLGIGRDPDGAELYLAHQQGAGGATKLINNPDANAASLVGTKAIIQNGGREDMTAREFVQMWANKYNGVKGATNVSGGSGATPGAGVPNMGVQALEGPGNEGISTAQLALLSGVGNAAPAAPAATPIDQAPPVQQTASSAAPEATGPMSLKADAYQRVMNDPNLSIEARQHALQYVNQTLASQQVAYEQDQRARKEANDHAADQIVQRVQSGNYTGVMDDINHNPNLNWETRIRLREVALKESENGAAGTAASYGSGFWDAMKGITAQPGDPSRITDSNEILKRAGPGGDLSLAGAQKLTEIMRANQKSPDQAAINDMQRGTLAYLKHSLSFSADYGTFKVPDPVGEDIFNSQAIPAFWKAYQDGIQGGKTPFQLLSKDSPDFIGSKIISAYKRSDAQEMKDRIAASDGATGGPQAAAPGAGPAAQQPPAPSTFKLETPEGIAQAYHAGSMSRAEAEQRLNALRNAASQVPNK